MERLERFLRDKVDSDQIDREGKIPEDVIQGLRDIGAFGIKIPTEYGGLGLSQTAYTHAIGLVTSVDGNLTALLSAAQSIGVPHAAQAVRHAGTEAEVPPPPGPRRGERVRAHRVERRIRSGRDEHHRGALSRRHALHPQRRKALVHQRHHRRADGGDGQHRSQEDHGVHRRDQLARASRWCSASTSWVSRRSRTASSASPT